MHYLMMFEKDLAARWQVSLKTLRRWRLDNEGPVWHKLFRHVRYHEANILEFESRSAQHLMTLHGIKREFMPAEPDATLGQGHDAKAEGHYFTAKEIAETASLPIHLFRDQAERNHTQNGLLLRGELRDFGLVKLSWALIPCGTTRLPMEPPPATKGEPEIVDPFKILASSVFT
jgi:hypothetical protein